MTKRWQQIRSRIFLTLLFGAFLAFSFFLMFSTFGYNAPKHAIQIAPKAWSDFGAHLPLIRSFSMGHNAYRLVRGIPVESPLFPGVPIRYHFGFYALAGLLERAGLRIDWALNIPSALGMFLLLVLIYAVSFTLFASPWVSALSALFFLCNGSLSFINFFKKHPLSGSTLTDITGAVHFTNFGPWDGGNITAFWNWNIYTNQRHLAFSYGLVLLIMYLVLRIAGVDFRQKQAGPSLMGRLRLFVSRIHKKLLRRRFAAHPRTGPSRHKKPLAYYLSTPVPVLPVVSIALCMSVLLFFNYAAAGIAMLFLAYFFLRLPESRVPLFLAAVMTALPFAYLLNEAVLTNTLVFEPGYLVRPPLTLPRVVMFWWENIGLHLVLIPLGILLSPPAVRRALLVPLLLLFILPNTFRLSTDMINNHKFFNFFMILGSMFSAYALVVFWRLAKRSHLLIRLFVYSFICLLFPFLTLSGLLDMFPVINDTQGGLIDYPGSGDIRFFMERTRPDDVIANSLWFYQPASMAGRAVYSGYTYFTWSYGYDQDGREKRQIELYRAPTKNSMCAIARENDIAYVELNQNPEAFLQPNLALWKSLPVYYKGKENNFSVYSIDQICGS